MRAPHPHPSMSNASGLSPAAGCAWHLRFHAKLPFQIFPSLVLLPLCQAHFQQNLSPIKSSQLRFLPCPLTQTIFTVRSECAPKGPGWSRSRPASSAPSPSGSSLSFENCSPDLHGLTSTYLHRLLSQTQTRRTSTLPSNSLIPGHQAHLPLPWRFLLVTHLIHFLFFRPQRRDDFLR